MSYNDDVEAVVNPHSENQQRKARQRIRRKLTAMATLLAVMLAVTVVWLFSAMPNAVAIGTSAICSTAAAFLGGQVWEAAR